MACDESIEAETICQREAMGQIVTLKNPFGEGRKVIGIGRELRTMANALVGPP